LLPLKNAFVRIKKALHIYIYIEREKRLERFGREKERERIGKTTRVASPCVVVEKEYIKVRNRSEIRKRYKREE